MTQRRGQPGKPGKPSEGRTGGAGGTGGTGGVGEQTGGAGGVGGAGGASSDGGDRNEGKGYWTQTGVVPRWQLFAVYVVIVAATATGFLRVEDARKDAVQRITKTADDTCMQDNQLREEVNRQAEAFVHHNDETLRWAIVVRRILDRSTGRGEDAFQATNRLVREYREVRDEYFTLPMLDCSDPERGRVSPSRPVAP